MQSDTLRGISKEIEYVVEGGGQTDSSGNDPRLLWTIPSIKDLFKENRMWPTFIGPKITQHGVARVAPPVLVWKEQQRYIELNSKKRKYEASSKGEGTIQVGDSPNSSSAGSVSESESLRSQVFEDLHDRGYFVGPADVYGGDYSLYKGGGDPTKTHSIATVRVLEGGRNKISVRELLAFSRVQNQVAKSAVLAFVPSSSTDRANTGASVAAPVAHAALISGEKLAGGDGDSNDDGGRVSKVVSGCGSSGSSNGEEGGDTDSASSAGSGDQLRQGHVGDQNKPKYIVINFRNVSNRS